MKLRVHLDYEPHPKDDPGSPGALPLHNVVLQADLDDVTVHQWYALFEQLLRLAGFAETTVMEGACALAFNEWRPQAAMGALVERYDLADLRRSAASPPSPDSNDD